MQDNHQAVIDDCTKSKQIVYCTQVGGSYVCSSARRFVTLLILLAIPIVVVFLSSRIGANLSEGHSKTGSS